MNVMFIDTYTRGLVMSSCHATRISGGDSKNLSLSLCLRWGTNVCSLHQGVKEQIEIETPVLVSLNTYAAQTSGGFTKVFSGREGEADVAGACGFPWLGSGSLRRLKTPIPCLLFPGGIYIRRIPSHADGRKNSNPGTAQAAFDGAALAAELIKGITIVAEGQSDYTKLWEIWPIDKENPPLQFNEEHRLDIVGDPGLTLPPMPREEEKRLPDLGVEISPDPE